MENIKLHNGDCMEGLKSITNKSIDMICCDLPYGITANKWDKGLDLSVLFKEYMRIIKDKGCIALFGCQPFTTDLINAGRKWFKYEIIWEKSKGTDFFNANRKPLRAHENILIFYKHSPKYNPQMEEGKPYIRNKEENFVSSIGKTIISGGTYDGKRFPRTVLKFSKEQGFHTTQKPVPLLEWLIKTYTDEGDLVLDNTMGSGTCAVACANLKRHFIGWEFDPHIFKIASNRVNDVFLRTIH